MLNNKLIYFSRYLLAFIAIFLMLKFDLIHPDKIFNSNVSALHLIKTFSLFMMVTLLGTLRWAIILRSLSFRIQFIKILTTFYFGLLCNLLLPGGYAGDLARVAGIADVSSDRKLTLISSVFVDRFIGFLSIILLATVMTFQFFFDGKYELFIAITALFAITISSLVFLFKFLPLLLLKIIKLFQGGGTLSNTISKVASAIYDVISSYSKIYRSLAINLTLSFSIQIIIAMILVDLLLAIDGYKIPFSKVLVASMAAQLSSILPLTPGGVGLAESAFSLALNYNMNTGFDYATTYFYFRVLFIIFCLPASFLTINIGASLYRAINKKIDSKEK